MDWWPAKRGQTEMPFRLQDLNGTRTVPANNVLPVKYAH